MSSKRKSAAFHPSKLHEYITCNVCLDIVQDPHLCPECSNIFCLDCLVRCYDANSQQKCPICRQFVQHIEEYVRCSWLGKLTEDIGKFESSTPSYHHHVSLYCNDCDEIVVWDSIEGNHPGHHISSLTDACTKVRVIANSLKDSLGELRSQLLEKQHLLCKSFNEHSAENKVYRSELSPLFKESLLLLYNRSNSFFYESGKQLKLSMFTTDEMFLRLDTLLKLPDSIQVLHESKELASQYEKFCSEEKVPEDAAISECLSKDAIWKCMSVCPEYTWTKIKLDEKLVSDDATFETNSIPICHLDFKMKIDILKSTDKESSLSLVVVFKKPELLKSTFDICCKVRILPQSEQKSDAFETSFLLHVGPESPELFTVPDMTSGHTSEECGLVVRFGVRPISYQTLSEIQKDYIDGVTTAFGTLNEKEVLPTLQPLLPRCLEK